VSILFYYKSCCVDWPVTNIVYPRYPLDRRLGGPVWTTCTYSEIPSASLSSPCIKWVTIGFPTSHVCLLPPGILASTDAGWKALRECSVMSWMSDKGWYSASGWAWWLITVLRNKSSCYGVIRKVSFRARVKWWAVENMVLNLQASWKPGNITTSCVNMRY
jgi:hypothetical protein